MMKRFLHGMSRLWKSITIRKNLDVLLVLYLHGAAGTFGSGFRPPPTELYQPGRQAKPTLLLSTIAALALALAGRQRMGS